jgi:hypothetical protein
MHTTNPAGLALLVRDTDLPSRLQSWLPDVPVACAATPAELAALLRDPRWRAVAIDVAALGERAEELLSRLSALFPDVPLIAIGSPADARRLEPLVSAGCVQRFLRQPLGQRRTRACLESVLSRPDCAARAPLPRITGAFPATRGTRRALAALVIAVAFLGIAVAVASGASSGARPGAARDADRATAVAAATARAAERAGHGGVARVAASAAAVDVAPLLAAAADASARGALFEPDGDNAVAYYRLAIAAAPGDARARIALDSLGTLLLAAGDDALARQRHVEAAGRAEQAARVLGDDARVLDLQARIHASEQAARQRAALRREAWAQAAREWSATARAQVPTPTTPGEPG